MSHSPHHAIVLCIGDELLDGRVSDRNIPTIARALALVDVEITSTSFVRDDPQAIAHRLLDGLAASPALVLVTGGLGPTQDDLTRQAASDAFNAPLIEDAHALSLLRARFASRGRRVTENNLIQARFPEGSTILYSEVGTAAGFMIEQEKTTLVFLPGVPSEVEWFMDHYIDSMLPHVQSGEALRGRELTFHLFGAGESALEHALLPLPEALAGASIKLSWLAKDPIITLRASSTDEGALARFATHTHDTLGSFVLSCDAAPFHALGTRLLRAGASITAAESCTGGLFGAHITHTPGSSGWFSRSFVTYSNESKQELLAVREETLERFGAVSAQTVLEMAQGARRAAERDRPTYAIAISGVAGPSGGSKEKPVGTVYLGLATPQGTHYAHRAYFHGVDRAQVRQRSVYAALKMLLWSLEGDHDPSVKPPLTIACSYSSEELDAGAHFSYSMHTETKAP